MLSLTLRAYSLDNTISVCKTSRNSLKITTDRIIFFPLILFTELIFNTSALLLQSAKLLLDTHPKDKYTYVLFGLLAKLTFHGL